MAGGYGANQYKQMQVKTANRGQILIMLYEAAIQNVKKAAAAIDRGDIAAKGLHIGKSHDIINELLATLDHNAGGDIARNLERLYNFMIEKLVKANIEKNKAPLLEVEKLLTTLLDGWRVAVEQVNRQQGQSAAPGQGQSGPQAK